MKKIFNLGICLLFFLILLPATFTQASNKGKGPPFKSGEVVIAGPPSQLLDEGLEIIKHLPRANITVVKVQRGRELASVQRYKSRGYRAGLNYIAHAMTAPNDQFYPILWNFTAVQSEAAWNLSTGSGVTVAVLDTGIATGGIDGINCLVAPWDAINDDASPDDGDGHGTHVSGTIAQATGNGIGSAGLAYNACIMPVKVLNDTGTGYFSDIAEGMYYAVDNGAKVINMSLGTDAGLEIRNDPIMDAALNYAYQNDVTVVCSAGNDGNSQNVSYPAIYPTTIAVGATDFNNNVTVYSNMGEGLDIVAPGGYLLDDLNNDGNPDGILQETYINGSWGFYFFDGTSSSSPHVAAVAAMLLSVNPTLSTDLIYLALTTTALDLYGSGYDATSGYGLLQAYDALASNPGVGENDADGDGMDNDWEVSNGLDPDDPYDAYYDFDGDGLLNLDEYHLGSDPQDPDTDNDGVWDSFDGYPLDDQLNVCVDQIVNNSSSAVFSSVQAALDDPNAANSDIIQVSGADFGEDILYDRNIILNLSGGYYCNYSDNPSASSVNSLVIKNGTIVVEKIIIKPPLG